jgi:hypothetical protein
MAATERVPVLMTVAEKKRIVARARKVGLTTTNTEKTIDTVLKYVAASNKRIARLEAKAKRKVA